MSPEQQAAYVIAQAACVTAEIAAMQAANTADAAAGRSPSFTSEDFLQLINSYGIHHNAVLTLFR